MAKLRGGPAQGLEVDDDRDITYVAVALDPAGRERPILTPDGKATALPSTANREAEAVLNGADRWACYRRINPRSDTPPEELDPGYDWHDDMPPPPEGETTYRWVCVRRTR